MKNKYLNYLLIVAIIFLSSFSFVNGAELDLQLEKTNLKIGESFTLSVYVNSGEQAINAVSGSISFPVDKLIVEDILSDKTIFNFWSVDPGYSNIDGSINFEGIVFNPGFIGQRGDVVKINFKATEEGFGSIDLVEGMVLANDGEGTDVLDKFSSIDFTISGILDDEIEKSEGDLIESTDENVPLLIPAVLTNNLPSWLVGVISNHYYFFLGTLFLVILLLLIIFYLLYKLHLSKSSLKEEAQDIT